MREDEKRERIPLRENEQQWRGRELQVRECFCTPAEKKNLREMMAVVFPSHSEVNHGWSVRVGED